MAQIRKIGMAAGTFSVALGIGFVMQNGDALASRFGGAADEPAPFVDVSRDDEIQPAQASVMSSEQVTPVDDLSTEAPLASSVTQPEEPSLAQPEPDIGLAAIVPEEAQLPQIPEQPVQLASVDPDSVPELETVEVAATETTEVDCVPTVMAAATDAAMVDLAVSAPCHGNTPFTVHHQGMMFTAVTNENGATKLTVPALAELAVMIVAFESGDGAVATVTVPDFAEYDRAILQWQGDAAVMLSAYEAGAKFGDETHIHAGNPGAEERIGSAEGGYMITLGDSSVEGALMAEVYTYPTGRMTGAPDVLLVAEAEITSENCGQELNAQSIQVSPTGNISALDLQMVMPDCDAVGDFLILQNMFEDLTLASR